MPGYKTSRVVAVDDESDDVVHTRYCLQLLLTEELLMAVLDFHGSVASCCCSHQVFVCRCHNC